MGRVNLSAVKIGPSDLLLLFILSLWTASSTLYSFKLLGLDQPRCWRTDPPAFLTHQYEFYGLCFCLFVNAMVGLLTTTLAMENADPEAAIGWRMRALSYIITAIHSIAVFISFLVVDPQARTCASLVAFVHLLLVGCLGNGLISLLRHYKICYGLFLGLLGGVVFTCYKGFGSQDPLLFQLMVFMSGVMILLGGLYLFLRAKELSFSKLLDPEDTIYC